MDRCRAVVAKDMKIFLNKVGMGIADGGDRIGGQEPAIQTILNFYVINEMIPVGGGSFGANLGGTFWSKDRGAEGVSEDSEGMRSLKKTLKKLIQTTLMVKKASSEEIPIIQPPEAKGESSIIENPAPDKTDTKPKPSENQ
jgi:multimeric flavodoxin WrbA